MRYLLKEVPYYCIRKSTVDDRYPIHLMNWLYWYIINPIQIQLKNRNESIKIFLMICFDRIDILLVSKTVGELISLFSVLIHSA